MEPVILPEGAWPAAQPRPVQKMNSSAGGEAGVTCRQSHAGQLLRPRAAVAAGDAALVRSPCFRRRGLGCCLTRRLRQMGQSKRLGYLGHQQGHPGHPAAGRRGLFPGGVSTALRRAGETSPQACRLPALCIPGPQSPWRAVHAHPTVRTGCSNGTYPAGHARLCPHSFPPGPLSLLCLSLGGGHKARRFKDLPKAMGPQRLGGVPYAPSPRL